MICEQKHTIVQPKLSKIESKKKAHQQKNQRLKHVSNSKELLKNPKLKR